MGYPLIMLILQQEKLIMFFSHHVVDADAQHLARFEVIASKQQAQKLEMAVLFVIYPLI